MMKVLLAGNPNVGKSTLFNGLTGSHQHTGNWSGKTVKVASGILRHDKNVVLVDLPGMYSLNGRTADEQVAAAYLMAGEGECVVGVCDGCCLERGLILALQIMEHRSKVIICINLMDEASRHGIRIDGRALSENLGVPVVFTSGADKRGLSNLKEKMVQTAMSAQRCVTKNNDPVRTAKELVQRCVEKSHMPNENWRLVLDRILVSSYQGYQILGLFLVLVLWLTIWGANYPSMALNYVFGWLYKLLAFAMKVFPQWLSGILLDGIYSTTTQVIAVMLPPLLIFFPIFTLLEDVGYLPRLAFLLERGMHRCGGCGKQALTLCMGLGCNAVGVTGCRIISSPKQRLAAILTNAMVPCNGRFPTLILLGTLFFGDALGSLLVAGAVILGVLAAMVSTSFLSRSLLRRCPHESCFLMEIPSLRRPQLRPILTSSIIDRTLRVAGRALMVAAPAGAVLWVMENSTMLFRFCDFLEPFGTFLGMNGKILASFILSFPANELFLPILFMSSGGNPGELLVPMGISAQMALTMMIFVLFHWPCSTTVLTIWKETGSIKKTAVAVLLPTAVGMMLCLTLKLLF